MAYQLATRSYGTTPTSRSDGCNWHVPCDQNPCCNDRSVVRRATASLSGITDTLTSPVGLVGLAAAAYFLFLRKKR